MRAPTSHASRVTVALPPLIGTLLACALLLAGCGGSGSSGGDSALRRIDPAALQATVDATAAELLVPGAVVLLRTPQGEFTVTYGSTERNGTTPPAPGDRFRIGSVTKTMTAAAIVQLAEEGKLAFDDPVARHRPEVPNGEHITVAQLLDMRSGLANYTAAPELWPALEADPTRVWTPEELVGLAFDDPYREPGTFEYCNTNTVLLGLIAEQLDQKPLAAIFRDRFFVPLGMADTELPAPTASILPAPRAHGYVYGGLRYVFVDVPYPPDIRAAAKAGTLVPEDFTDLNPSWAWAAGGVVSTTTDLATWIEALVGGELFDTTYARAWRESLLPVDPRQPDGLKYGYGIVELPVGPSRILFHNGELPGYNTFAGHDPDNQVTLVLWTSLPVSVDNTAPAETLLAKLLPHIYEAARHADPDIPGD